MMRSSLLRTYDDEERFGRVKGIGECTQDLPIGERRDDADCGQVLFLGLMHSGMRRTLSVSLLCVLQHKQPQEELEKRTWVREGLSELRD